MRSKQLSKKLSLKKTTMTNLDNKEMIEAYGGAELTDYCIPTGRTYCFTRCIDC